MQLFQSHLKDLVATIVHCNYCIVYLVAALHEFLRKLHAETHSRA